MDFLLFYDAFNAVAAIIYFSTDIDSKIRACAWVSEFDEWIPMKQMSFLELKIHEQRMMHGLMPVKFNREKKWKRIECTRHTHPDIK